MRAYSSAQLERMVQRQVQVQRAWKVATPCTYSARVVHVTTLDPLDHGMAERSSRVIQADLLPGGRWLLIMSAAGSITAWDLESSPPLGSMIIHQDTRPGERPRMASLCVYGDDDYLKLDIAISTCLVKAEGVAATRCIIWKVHLDPLKGLQAEHSSAFDVNDSWISNGSLGERFYAGLFLTQRGIKSGSGAFSQTVVVLDRHNSSIAGVRGCILENASCTQDALDLRVLPSDRLLILYRDRLLVCEIPFIATFPHSLSLHGAPFHILASVELKSKLSRAEWSLSNSEPWVTERGSLVDTGTMRFTLYSPMHFYTLLLPRWRRSGGWPDIQVQVFKTNYLGGPPCWDNWTALVGRNRGILWKSNKGQGPGGFGLALCSLPIQQPGEKSCRPAISNILHYSQTTRSSSEARPHFVLFDEYSGRVIFQYQSQPLFLEHGAQHAENTLEILNLSG
ncbi:hypothetical protein FRC03_003114 [Tulasnella sp. 419]|nr:hypothetical protein FRC03_003114 [Tulasnella sp. 419]